MVMAQLEVGRSCEEHGALPLALFSTPPPHLKTNKQKTPCVVLEEINGHSFPCLWGLQNAYRPFHLIVEDGTQDHLQSLHL